MPARRRRYSKPLPPRRGPSYDTEIPVAGHYLVKLRKGGPPVALRLWWGPPLDPETGEPMDRAPRWNCMLNGVQPVDVADYWPGCAKLPISAAEHDRIATLSKTQDRASPFYDPLRSIDRLKAPLPFATAEKE
jgi:hypothetical protein